MNRRVKSGAALLALLTCAPALAATPTEEEILQKAAKATKTVAFVGTRLTTLWLGNRTEAFEAKEYADGHGRFRIGYTAPRSARGRVVIDNGKAQWLIEPSARNVVRSQGSSPQDDDEIANIKLLLTNFKVALVPGSHILAHRPCYKLTLAPSHAGILARTLWIDKETFLVLKREARTAKGAPERITVFTEVRFNPELAKSLFEHQPSSQKVAYTEPPKPCKDRAAAQQFLGTTARFPKELALGFELRSAFCQGSGRKRSVHLLYEDGIETLSVFIDLQTNRIGMKNSKSVFVNRHRASFKTDHFDVLRFAAEGLRYTLIGDLEGGALLNVGRDLHARHAAPRKR